MTAQSAGLEQRARELLAAEYERDGVTFVPDCLRHDSQLTLVEQRAIRAIVAALAAPAADGVIVPRELLEQLDSALMWDLHRRPYRHRVAQQKLIGLIREYAPAAPQAQGEGK